MNEGGTILGSTFPFFYSPTLLFICLPDTFYFHMCPGTHAESFLLDPTPLDH